MEHVDLYRDVKGFWRWRHVAANGNIVSDSAEGYWNRGDCLAMAEKLNPNVPIGEDDSGDLPHDPPLNEMGC